MKILIAAIGKMKSGPEQALYTNYIKRLSWPVQCRELEAKAQGVDQRRRREADLLLAASQGYERLVALDESGEGLSSQEFAGKLAGWQQGGISSFAFLIGGSDGLDTGLLKKSHLIWSLGRVTWPHLLVRALLAEQLYRSYTLLANHPYHRA